MTNSASAHRTRPTSSSALMEHTIIKKPPFFPFFWVCVCPSVCPSVRRRLDFEKIRERVVMEHTIIKKPPFFSFFFVLYILYAKKNTITPSYYFEAG